VVGDQVADVALDRDGIELVVNVNGRTVSVAQETDGNVDYQPGDSVWVIGSNSPRSRCESGVRVLPQS
jgi:hypothetical protein